MNMKSEKAKGLLDRAKAFERTKTIPNPLPMDNPMNIDDGMLDTENTKTCPICKAKESEEQPQSGTHCITTRYECGTEITMAIWQGGNDPEYHFDKRCDEPPRALAKNRDIVNALREKYKIKVTDDPKDIIFMNIANEISKMSKCVSKQVGSVVVKDARIISIGYNGTPKGWKNCNEVFEYDNFDREKHHKFSEDHEIHGELNALLFASRNSMSVEGATLYCTLEPCMNCLKNVCQSGIKRIVFRDFYDLKESYSQDTFDMLEECSIIIERVEQINPIKMTYPLGCS